MKPITKFKYNVEPDEEVTIVATPHGANGAATATLDGDDLISSGPGHTPKFVFDVSAGPGDQHIVLLRGEFFPDDSPNASYAISLSGSAGGGSFSGGSMDRPDEEEEQAVEANYEFRVAAASPTRGRAAKPSTKKRPTKKPPTKKPAAPKRSGTKKRKSTGSKKAKSGKKPTTKKRRG